MTRLLPALSLAVVAAVLAPTQAADKESSRVTATREKMLPAKLKLDVDSRALRDILKDDLPDAVKDATKGLVLKIEPAPGAGVTLPSKFTLKGEMTLAEALDKLCADKSWGWYVNVGKEGDQKDGAIFLTTNGKEHGYKEGTGPGGKEVAKKDPPKGKSKDDPKTDPKGGGDDKEAAEMLSKAKLQISLKQPDKAKATLDEIIEKYPDSKQAANAKKLLEKIGK